MLFLACADGAGSAPCSDRGSRIACDELLQQARGFAATGNSVSDLTANLLCTWFVRANHALVREAVSAGRPTRDFGCTLLLALSDDSTAAFAQLGDGVIVRSSGDGYAHVFWPQSGEFVNQTYFVSEHSHLSHMQVCVAQPPAIELALMTDGLERLALKFESNCVHEPFFRPLFDRLRQESPGHLETLQDSVAAFLESPSVNSRTDDDKTLIVATRRDARRDVGFAPVGA